MFKCSLWVFLILLLLYHLPFDKLRDSPPLLHSQPGAILTIVLLSFAFLFLTCRIWDHISQWILHSGLVTNSVCLAMNLFWPQKFPSKVLLGLLWCFCCSGQLWKIGSNGIKFYWSWLLITVVFLTMVLANMAWQPWSCQVTHILD